MAIKTFNTRIQNKRDEYNAWVTNDPVLLSGEICTVVIPAETGAVQQEPTVLMKVGDGTSKWSALPWLGAVACDIYNWAKAPVKPEYQASEIKNLADFISGEIQDSNTTYKLEQDESDKHIIKLYSKELNGEWTLATSITTADTVYDDSAIAGRITALETKVGNDTVSNQIDAKITALNLSNTYDAKGAAAAVDTKLATEIARAEAAEKVNADAAANAKSAADTAQAAAEAAQSAADAAQGEVDALEQVVGVPIEGKTIVEMIADAQTAATYDDTQVKADIKNNADAITDLVSTHAADKAALEGSIALNASQADLDALESTHATDKAELQGGIDAVSGKVTTLIGDDADKSVRTIANEELAKQLIPENAAESLDTLAEIAAWIQAHPDDASAMNAAIVALQAKVDTGDKTVSAYVGDAITALKIGDYALAADLVALAARVTALEGKAHEHANKALLDTYTQAEADLADAVAKKHNHANAAELEKIVDGDVAKWNAAQSNAEKTASDALAAAKSELNTEIAKKANTADLHAIATSGNVGDLEQTADTYFIINCGTASTLV